MTLISLLLSYGTCLALLDIFNSFIELNFTDMGNEIQKKWVCFLFYYILII